MLATLGAIAFSAKAIIVKLAYRHGVDAVTLIMYRMLFALPIFALMAWWASRGKPPLTRKDWFGIVGLGVTGYLILPVCRTSVPRWSVSFCTSTRHWCSCWAC